MNQEKTLTKNNDKRTKCMVYTRVMGYHRPVESFNIGKKGEHQERKSRGNADGPQFGRTVLKCSPRLDLAKSAERRTPAICR